MPRGISRCPNCKEPVTPYAAGCAICGYDLVAARAEAERRQASVAGLPARALESVPRPGDEALRIGIAALVVLFAPLFGALLAAYFAYDADRDGRTMTRNVMLFLTGFGVVLLFSPFWLWGGPFVGI